MTPHSIDINSSKLGDIANILSFELTPNFLEKILDDFWSLKFIHP